MSAITAFVTLAMLAVQAFVPVPVGEEAVNTELSCVPYPSADAEAKDVNVFVDCDAAGNAPADADVYGGVDETDVALGSDGGAANVAWKTFQALPFP